MSENIPFVFASAPASPSEIDAAMPCYRCCMLGYGIKCQDCSRFTATSPTTPPSTPASDFAFSFKFTTSLKSKLSTLEDPITAPRFAPATKQSRWDWTKLEAAEHSTKPSRFNWSEIDFCSDENAFERFPVSHEDTTSSISSRESESCYGKAHSKCAVCSMVPYGALCTSCDQVQTSKAMTLATPPAAAWPMLDRLGDYEGTKKPEEELLQSLDMELFELINVPHELDEWGRRVYNDCGHRIIYCVDEDGNTVMGYEAWYPSSVTGDYEEPDDWRFGEQPEDPMVEDEDEHAEYDDCGRPILYTADSEGNTIDGYEACYANSVLGDYAWAEPDRAFTHDDVLVLDFEQQRLAEFLAAQDDELPQFRSDRERIAAWIATSSVSDDEDTSVLDRETKEMVSQWYTNFGEIGA